MKINIYVNWEERKISTYEDFIEAVIEEVEENLDEWGENWFDEHYTNWELFNLQDSEKTEIEQKMKDELIRDIFNDHTAREWDIVKIEI